MNPRRLIINADDLGFSPGVTAGILHAHREGIVTSTTLAANMPAAAEAVEQLCDAPDLGVGVHLNACQGPALSDPGRRVLAEGAAEMNTTASRLVRRCLLRPGRMLAAIGAEFEAQIAWCLDHGLHPTHADSHRHVHAWPAVFALVVDLCRKYDIRCLRRHGGRVRGPEVPPAGARSRRIAGVLAVLAWRNARRAPEMFATSGTLGVAHTGRIDVAFLLAAARSLPAGATEIMVHPGYADDLSAGQTRLLECRRGEIEALCDAGVRRCLDEGGIELTHYGKLR